MPRPWWSIYFRGLHPIPGELWGSDARVSIDVMKPTVQDVSRLDTHSNMSCSITFSRIPMRPRVLLFLFSNKEKRYMIAVYQTFPSFWKKKETTATCLNVFRKLVRSPLVRSRSVILVFDVLLNLCHIWSTIRGWSSFMCLERAGFWYPLEIMISVSGFSFSFYSWYSMRYCLHA